MRYRLGNASILLMQVFADFASSCLGHVDAWKIKGQSPCHFAVWNWCTLHLTPMSDHKLQTCYLRTWTPHVTTSQKYMKYKKDLTPWYNIPQNTPPITIIQNDECAPWHSNEMGRQPLIFHGYHLSKEEFNRFDSKSAINWIKALK